MKKKKVFLYALQLRILLYGIGVCSNVINGSASALTSLSLPLCSLDLVNLIRFHNITLGIQVSYPENPPVREKGTS
jgi:hypothetical protein